VIDFNKFRLRWRLELAVLAALVALAVAVAICPRVAWADSPFDGKWKQGALHEEYTVQQWLPGCGPAPVSGNSGGGDIVSIREEGDELSIVGGGRVFKSNQCYDPLPTLARDAHSRDPSGRTWRTRCSTPAADPRRALMQTLVAATSDTHIDVVETGRYEITLNEGRCIADVKRSRGFDLVSRDGVPTTPSASTPTPPPTPTPTPTPTPRQACTPGDPARLEVRPSRKLMRPGETFVFRAVVTDANGCPTPTATSWALADTDGAPRVKLEGNGRVTALDGAPEGTSDLVVTAAERSVHVTVEVASAARYDDLLTKQGLNAAGENDAAATAVIAGSSIGGADAKAEDSARKRKTIFVAIVGTLVLVLGILALVYSKRAKKAAAIEKESEARHQELVREAEERKRAKLDAHVAQQRAHEESILRVKRAAEAAVGTMLCTTCKREFPPPAGNFCPQDATRLVPLADADEGALAPAGGVCPVCRRGFQPGVKVCPTDKEELLPYAAVAATATVSAQGSKGKICPTCGDRFEGGASFCGKDGTALVLLN
jgi:hypothetical protein